MDYSIKKNNKRWAIFHNFERRWKNIYLRRLSDRKSYEIYAQLCEFAGTITISAGRRAKRLERNKIGRLSRIHSIFNKAKCGNILL